jgi:putative transposase
VEVDGDTRVVRNPLMARFARVVVPGWPHHVTHRGNRREPVFFEESDRTLYRDLLRDRAARYELEVWAYCWMGNHVHLLVVGHRPDSLARAIGTAHREYSRIINRRRGWTGHLWANRFHSVPLTERQMYFAARYIELNPVRAGLVGDPVDYPWSSARAHLRGDRDPLLAPHRPLPGAVGDWRTWIEGAVEPEELESLRAATASGRPAGPEEFLRDLERRLGRRLRPRRPGPPRRDFEGQDR